MSELERFRDALDHIGRVARHSRTQSQRDRWIAYRAHCALNGSEAWKGEHLPRLAETDALEQRLQRTEELLRDAQAALPRMGKDDIIPGGGLPCQTKIGDQIDAYFGEQS